MNDKYKYSKFLESLFRIQDFIPSRARRKYFDRVRTLLIQQDKAVFARKKKHVSASWRKEKNKKTKTFCRFSYGYRGFYIDVYEPCGLMNCNFPYTYVMSRNRKKMSTSREGNKSRGRIES
ncbi:unnamed protein product [Rhizophagus irregularis]|uniref:Uncharacterized protein n=1 Tax=Rhizophagus irregularis TaxID=588596 RepID=A0A2N1NZ59_9GLOM|nr:hypothetical protein RhiirC2_769449 [Rhizophagus irregularis]CAB4376503.1 unnamed protein product [Rhizophagus irregularis]CAB5369778.1 unnamed protein product [Rhizophagus irregularis]